MRKGHCLVSGPSTMTSKSTAALGTVSHHETQCTWQHEEGNTQHSCMSLMQILLLFVDTLSPLPPPSPSHPVLNAPEDIHSGKRCYTVPRGHLCALLVSLSAKSPVLESAHVHVCETEDPGQECPELEATSWPPGSDSEFLHTRCSTSVSS